MTETENNMKEPTKEDFLEKTLASNKNAVAQKCQLRICTFLKFCFRDPCIFKGANMEEVSVENQK